MKTNKPPGETQAANQSRGLANKPSGETQMANQRLPVAATSVGVAAVYSD